MLSELPINTRKWRKYSQYIVVNPQLDEETKIKQAIQRDKLSRGEQIAEVDLIRDPEPYEEKHYKFSEFEAEGSALEEFLMTLGDYSDVVRAKTERWKTLVSAF